MRGRYVIGTRGSALAMCQTQMVQTRLEERYAKLTFEIARISVTADRAPERPLAAMSGEGVFVKELETALLEGRIDLAVHSLKDLPLQAPPGLHVVAVLKRAEPRDALISRSGQGYAELPSGSRIGTSSLRRQSQLRAWRHDVRLLDIRGNVDTRLRKVDEGWYDAIVVAACGLIRLGLQDRITEYLGVDRMLPEPGQGALAVEARSEDAEICELLRRLDDAPTRACVESERAFLHVLGGGCRVPIAALASHQQDTLTVDGAVIALDGTRHIRGQVTGSMHEGRAVGERLGRELIAQGAKELLRP